MAQGKQPQGAQQIVMILSLWGSVAALSQRRANTALPATGPRLNNPAGLDTSQVLNRDDFGMFEYVLDSLMKRNRASKAVT